MAKTLTGIVSSDKTDKTIIVTIRGHKTHPLYKKQYTVTKRYMAHDEKNEAHEGDTVMISECRPLSARKRHQLTKILERPVIAVHQTVEAITAEPAEVKTADEPAAKAVAKPKAKAAVKPKKVTT